MKPVAHDDAQFTGPKRTLNLEPLEQRLLLQADWTFMVYMDGDNNLESAAITNFLQMAHVGSDADVNVVVELDRSPLNQTTGGTGYTNAYGDWSGAREGLVNKNDVPSSTWGTSLGPTDMGDPATLQAFITYAINNNQADHYALILWDHGSGYSGVQFDDTSNDYLTMNELSSGMAAGLAATTVNKIDVLGFDGCLMSMVEVADQVKGVANLMVTSEDTVPYNGLPYDQVLAQLEASPLMKPVELATTMSSDYLTYYNFTGTYSVVDLQEMGPLASSLDSFAQTFTTQGTGTDRNELEQHWISAPLFAVPDFIDVGVLMTDISADPLMSQPIRAAADAVLGVYADTIIANYSGSNSAGGSGLSIYLPGRSGTVDPDYTGANLTFASETHWDEFLNWWTGVPGATWTFMVYMDGDNNLEPYAIQDFLEMASVGSTQSVNIVVQLDRAAGYDTSYGNWTDTRRGLVNLGDVPDTSWGTSIGEADMGAPSTLTDFVTWAETTYPAQHYALTLWDHGGGLVGAMEDFDNGAGDWSLLSVAGNDQALQTVPDHIDVLRFDACEMSMLEVAYQMRNDATYMVASEDLGWAVGSLGILSPYDQILGQLTTDPTMSALDLANSMANLYFHAWSIGNLTVMASVVDLSKVSTLAQDVSNLGTAAMTVGTAKDRTLMEQHREAAPFYPSDGSEGDQVVDLGTWLAAVAGDSTISSSITSAAATALGAYDDAVLADFTTPGTGTGLAIYMPGSTPTGEIDPLTGQYIPYTWQNYAFAGDTQWPEFLSWWVSNEVTPIAFYQSGTAKVTIYDVYGIRDIDPADVLVKLSGSSVKSITLIGTDPLNGLGIVISGATSVGSITDRRTAPGTIAFIASNTGAKSVQINSAIGGEFLNGRSLGGMIFPSSIDGNPYDETSLYFKGGIGTLALNGALEAGAFIGGPVATATLKNCDFWDDVEIMGNVGKMTFTGTGSGWIYSRLYVKGSLSQLSMPVGGIAAGAILDITGTLGKANIGYIEAGYVDVITPLGTFADIDPRTFDFSQTNFFYTRGATVRVRGGIGTMSVGWFTPGTVVYDNVTTAPAGPGGTSIGVNQRYFITYLMSNVLAPSIGALNVAGSIDDARIMAGADLGADLLPGGTGVNADTYGVGRIGSVSVGTNKAWQLLFYETAGNGDSTQHTDTIDYGWGDIQDSLVVAGAFRGGVPGYDNWGGSGYNLVTLHDQRLFEDGSSIGKVTVAHQIISSYNEPLAVGNDFATATPPAVPEFPFFVPFGVGSYKIGSLNVNHVAETPVTKIAAIGFWYRDPYVFVELPRGLGYNA